MQSYETCRIDQQWYCSLTANFARWQHPAMEHGVRCAVCGTTCSVCSQQNIATGYVALSCELVCYKITNCDIMRSAADLVISHQHTVT